MRFFKTESTSCCDDNTLVLTSLKKLIIDNLKQPQCQTWRGQSEKMEQYQVKYANI